MADTANVETGTESLIDHLKSVLLELNAHPYPEVACPPGVPKRASVALILRIQPNDSHWPAVEEKHLHSCHPSRSHGQARRRSSAASNSGRGHKLEFKDILNAFFEQDWVKHGDPELLFIKRATRVGDKWNGHVALPGGKRDPEDEDDQVTAVREALEEVGVDLGYNNAIAVGNLPQRIVTTSWGKVPVNSLMTLCPYIYLLTSPTYPAQRLQPTEVASTHWVPIRALQSPQLRTHEYADVSARLAKSELGIKKWFLQAMLSKMMFAAIRLVPSNSTYCSTIPDFIPEESISTSSVPGITKAKELFLGPEKGANHRRPPLLLWGLTLGVVSDFLEHIPPHNALELWTYPTFTNWDVRFVMSVMSYGFRKRKAVEMSSMSPPPAPAADANTVADPPLDSSTDFVNIPRVEQEVEAEDQPGEVGIAGLGVGRNWGKTGRAKMIARGAAVNSMLEGYYPIVRKAVATALVGRISVVALVALYASRRYGIRWSSLFDTIFNLGRF